MPISLSNFKDLLEEYFAVKNAPEKGNKKSNIDLIKVDIYNDFLNHNYQNESGVRPIDSKVLNKFFSKVDIFEKGFMESRGYTNLDLGNITTGNALSCATEFIINFVDYDLLEDEIREELLRASKKKESKKKKSKKRKSKK